MNLKDSSFYNLIKLTSTFFAVKLFKPFLAIYFFYKLHNVYNFEILTRISQKIHTVWIPWSRSVFFAFIIWVRQNWLRKSLIFIHNEICTTQSVARDFGNCRECSLTDVFHQERLQTSISSKYLSPDLINSTINKDPPLAVHNLTKYWKLRIGD